MDEENVVCVHVCVHILSWTKSSSRFFHKMLQKNWNELLGQPNIIISRKKEGNPAICDNIDGPWECYASWNKSDRQILYDLPYMRNLQKNTLREKDNRFVITREWGFGSGGFERMYSKGPHFQLNTYWRYEVQPGGYSFHCCMFYLKLFKSTFSRFSSQGKSHFFPFLVCVHNSWRTVNRAIEISLYGI